MFGTNLGLTGLWQFNHVELLALLWSRAVGRDEGVHEGLEVGTPPLGEAVTDVPVALCLAVAQTADRSQSVV